MKKLIVAILILSLSAIGYTSAESLTTNNIVSKPVVVKKIAPKRKVIKRAPKKALASSTATGSTSTQQQTVDKKICPVKAIIIKTSFSGTKKERYQQVTNHIQEIISILSKMRDDSNCGQQFNDFYKIYGANKSTLEKYQEDSLIAYRKELVESINLLQTKIDYITINYKSINGEYVACIKINIENELLNKGLPHLECGKDPDSVIEDLKRQIQKIRNEAGIALD